MRELALVLPGHSLALSSFLTPLNEIRIEWLKLLECKEGFLLSGRSVGVAARISGRLLVLLAVNRLDVWKLSDASP